MKRLSEKSDNADTSITSRGKTPRSPKFGVKGTASTSAKDTPVQAVANRTNLPSAKNTPITSNTDCRHQTPVTISRKDASRDRYHQTPLTSRKDASTNHGQTPRVLDNSSKEARKQAVYRTPVSGTMPSTSNPGPR